MSELEDFLEENEPHEDEPEVLILKRRIQKLQQQLKRQQGGTSLIVEAVREAIEDMPPLVVPEAPKKSRAREREIAVLHLSDWQIGSMTTTFSTEAARTMVFERLLPKVRRIVDARRAGAKVDELVILIGGDMVDGSGMRSNHPWEVDSHVYTQACEDVPHMLGGLILALMADFPTIRCYHVRGNHGRSGPRKADPNPTSVNWDTVASRCTELMLGDAIDGKRLSFEVEVERWYKVVDVGDKKILLIHGDQFRGTGGFAGIPYYSIAKKTAKWALSLDEEWDVIMFGHLHVPSAGMIADRPWYLNGTLQTDSEFALEVLGECTRPAQRLMFFDPERGPIGDSVIWLD